MSGFFGSVSLVRPRISHLTTPKCGTCGFYQSCLTPKIEVKHSGKASILLVFDYPSFEADEAGVHRLPEEYEHLVPMFRRFRIEKKDVAITSALICRPTVQPEPKHLEACLPNLLRTIHEIKPEKILVFGPTAISALMTHLWQSSAGAEAKWWRWCIPSEELGAYVMCFPDLEIFQRERIPAGIIQLVHNGLIEILGKQGRPRPFVRHQNITLIHDQSAAVDKIEEIIEAGMPCAVDYETNMLKPDGDDARIICAGICQAGDETVAFPWGSRVEEAMRKFIQSPLKKIAANMKFEDRWTRRMLGHGIRNLVWDTMQAAHVLDNRPEITSVKFQAFVRLGVARYDQRIKPYLESRQGGRHRSA